MVETGAGAVGPDRAQPLLVLEAVAWLDDPQCGASRRQAVAVAVEELAEEMAVEDLVEEMAVAVTTGAVAAVCPGPPRHPGRWLVASSWLEGLGRGRWRRAWRG